MLIFQMFPDNTAETSDILFNIADTSGNIADTLAKTADIGLILLTS